MSKIQIQYVKVKCAQTVSGTVAKVMQGNSMTFIGNSSLPLVYKPSEIDKVSTSFVHTNNQALPLPAIPIVMGEKVMIVPVVCDIKCHVRYSSNVLPAKILKLTTALVDYNTTTGLKLPKIVTVDASNKLSPVVTDSLGRQYHTAGKVHIMYTNDAIEAQAAVMSSTIPLDAALVSRAKSYLKLLLPNKEPGTTFIYQKDRFIDVFDV